MRVSQSLVRTIALALCAAPVCAQAADGPLRMAPASQWVVDYADASCAVRRAFSAGDDQAILEFRQYGPGDDLEMLVVSRTLARKRGIPRVRFGPDDEWFEPVAPQVVNTGTGQGVLYRHSLRPGEREPKGEARPAWSEQDREAREQSVWELTVSRSFERDLTLETGRLHQPMEAMRACVEELVTHWGLGPVAQGPLMRSAKPIDLEDWTRRTLENYPADMVSAGKSGRVEARLIVGKDGKPTSCYPRAFAEPSFLQAACNSLIQHARFEPALDGNGEPVAGTYFTTVVYETRP